jgi:hypothetical protein
MIKIPRVLLFSSIALLQTVTVSAADRVHQGQWETTFTSGSAKPSVTKHCITAAGDVHER